MKSIIVTVLNENGTCGYDLELPVDLAGEQLLIGIVDTMKKVNPSLNFGLERFGLYLNRIQRFLDSKETLYEAGVRNGDYLTVSVRI